MKKLRARLNYGRWIADCDLCNGAEIVEPGKPFICFSCEPAAVRNPRLANNPRDVIFPKNKADIEQVMANRPEQYRNWFPGESLAALQKENAEHGIKE